jgi:tRNA pseudouridine38-40 synthase
MKKSRERAAHTIRNVKMVLEYDGTNYCGFQTQKNGVTIQSVLEKSFAKILGKRVPIIASGRTDAGVHAVGHVFNIKAEFPMDDGRLLMGINSILPGDIAVKSVKTVDKSFHARRDAKWKRYRYVIINSKVPSPLQARTSWRVPVPLDVKKMRDAAKTLVGEHDFRSFMGKRSSVKTTVRNIISLTVKKTGARIVVDVTANGFLKYMVRIIVGTLVEVGKGSLLPGGVKKVLAGKERANAGPTAPPHGLCLVEVGYE